MVGLRSSASVVKGVSAVDVLLLLPAPFSEARKFCTSASVSED